uniref:E3 ubiquitin-protein ligase TRIM9 n=1 Tax=Anthurium amnicola TaxID=1678845 RepID=A0A1D1Z7P9_9ARAE
MHRGIQKSDACRSFRRTPPAGGQSSEREGCAKTSSPSVMELSVHSRRACEGTRPTCIGDREEGRTLAYRGNQNSDLQLLHISREAQKLNHMIDSWSRSPSFDGRTRDIASDLLQGALDLQESLLMLGKLQEAPSFMAQTRRKQCCSFSEEEEAVGETCLEVMGSRRFQGRSYQDTQQGQRIPVDRSSRNRMEELKKVVRDGLHRENLLPISSVEEKASPFRSVKLPSRHGFGDPCGEQGHKAGSSGSFAAVGQKKAKATNLIARLMGLEDCPSEVLPTVRSKPERKKDPNHPRKFFEMPKPSKPPAPEERPHPGTRKTLQEIMGTMLSNGLLKAERSADSHFLSPVDRHVRGFSNGDEAPPIVIMKPMNSASLKMEELEKGLVESNLSSEQKKWQFCSVTEEEPAVEWMLPKEIQNRAKKSMGMDKVEELSETSKTSASSSHLKQLKKEMNKMRKKLDGMQNPVHERGRSEKKSVRSVTVSAPQIKTDLPTPRAPEKRPVQVKYHVSTKASSSNREDRHSAKPATRKPIDTASAKRTMKVRPQPREPGMATPVDGPNPKEETKEIITAQEKTIPAMLLASNVLPKETEHNSISSKRDIGKESSFHCEVMPKRSYDRGSLLPTHAPKQQVERKCSITVPAESTDRLKCLLSSSPSFLCHAQELFNISLHQPADCYRTETMKIETDDYKLLLACSRELMASRSYRSELLAHPLLLGSSKRRVAKISLNQLVEEISQEIENLRGYSKVGDAVASTDSLYGRLERDLKYSRVVAHGVWDWGWMEVPVEEADRIVRDVEKHVLEVLVEEIAVELMR